MTLSRLHLNTRLRYVLLLCSVLIMSASALTTAIAGDMPQTAIPNAKEIAGGIMTGGQPSEADLKVLAAEGFDAIINLRAEGEFSEFDEQALVMGLGMDYISIPMPGPDYLGDSSTLAQLEHALSMGNDKVMIHCGSGNRAGALIALHAYFIKGLDPQAAFDLGKDAGLTNLAPAVRARLGLSEHNH